MKKDLYKAYYNQLNDVGKKNAPRELFWEGDFSLLTVGLRVSVVGSREALETASFIKKCCKALFDKTLQLCNIHLY